MINQLLSELKKIYETHVLPEHNDLLVLTDEAITVLERESDSYRPRQKTDDGEKGGGLLDFSDAPELPLIVVPDLHARCDFFMHLMETPLSYLGIGTDDGESAESLLVIDALAQKKIRIVCVGDLFHSEMRGRNRWLSAWNEYERGNYTSEPMTEEMQENLTLFQMVLRVKGAYPEHFHFLKGNHENILNESGRGNYPFIKFADEGNMVYDFMFSRYGDAILHMMSLWEHTLPLCAVFPGCVVSHAEPKHVYAKKKIIDYEENPSVVIGLTWTANDEADDASVKKTMANLLGKSRAKNAVWLSGHRPVQEKFALRQGGKLVQIHNPSLEQVAVILPGHTFCPDTDIIQLE